MGIKSTYHINRQTAIAVIVGKLNSCTNEQLAEILESFEESYFRNYIAHNQLPEELDEHKTIRNSAEF